MEQNYQSTMESPKLSIDATVMEAVHVKKELPLPYYFKTPCFLCKVVTKDWYISVFDSLPVCFVSINNVNVNLKEVSSGTPIAAEEFEAGYDKAMTHIKMMNQDKASTEPDPNVEIDELIERRKAV
jgi:hypothetical protein